jgi:hypothetical protein
MCARSVPHASYTQEDALLTTPIQVEGQGPQQEWYVTYLPSSFPDHERQQQQ